MATTSSETAQPRKTPPASAGKTGSKTGAKARPKAATKNGGETPGEIIAERYRDTAYEGLVGPNGENVAAVMSAGEAVFAGLAEVSQEMMAFAGRRLRDDMETAEDLAKTTSPEELFEKQCSFAKRAAEHYAEETSKMIAMMARIQQSCWAPMEACTKAALSGLNEAQGEGSEKNKPDDSGAKD
jgi:hypothetical protein